MAHASYRGGSQHRDVNGSDRRRCGGGTALLEVMDDDAIGVDSNSPNSFLWAKAGEWIVSRWSHRPAMLPKWPRPSSGRWDL